MPLTLLGAELAVHKEGAPWRLEVPKFSSLGVRTWKLRLFAADWDMGVVPFCPWSLGLSHLGRVLQDAPSASGCCEEMGVACVCSQDVTRMGEPELRSDSRFRVSSSGMPVEKLV